MGYEASKAKDEIGLLDQTIKHFESDLNFVSPLAANVAVNGQRALQQCMKDYSEITKRIALGDENGLKDLSSLNDEFSHARVNLLVQAAVESAAALKAKITSPLWFGDLNSFLDGIAQVQDTVANLQDKDLDFQEKAEQLRHELTKIRELTGRIETTGRRVQYKVPFQVLVWGVPIVIGVALSGKFADWWIWLTLIMVIIAVLSHFLLKEAEKTKKLLTRIKVPTSRLWGSILPPLVGIVISVVMVISTSLPDYLIKKAFDIQTGTIPLNVKTGTSFVVPLSVSYNKDDIAFDININLDSTAFESDTPHIKFRALSRQPQTGNILIQVPTNLPPGQYMMKLMCSFKAKKKHLFEDESLGTFIVEKIIRVTVSN